MLYSYIICYTIYMKVPACRICGVTENLYSQSRYTPKNGTPTSYTFICRACNTERLRRYRETPEGRMAVRRAVKKYEESHPDRKRAWGVAGYTHESGPCSLCGESPADRHHPDIRKPKEIVFLCRLHHKRAHSLVESI